MLARSLAADGMMGRGGAESGGLMKRQPGFGLGQAWLLAPANQGAVFKRGVAMETRDWRGDEVMTSTGPWWSGATGATGDGKATGTEGLREPGGLADPPLCRAKRGCSVSRPLPATALAGGVAGLLARTSPSKRVFPCQRVPF